jgi:hypothetical protein
MRKFLALMVLLVAAGSALACGPGPIAGRPWEKRANTTAAREQMPIAEVEAKLVHRPSSILPGGPIGCDQFARFQIRIKLKSATSEPADYGYEFRISSKDEPLTTLPDYPVQGKSVDDFVEFEVEVYDYPATPRSSIDIEVEVRPVDRRLRRGEKATFRLHADASDLPNDV